MSRELKFVIRIDDPPWSDEAEEIENFAKVARKYNAPLTLAICSGWLNDLPELQKVYKKYYDEGLMKIACHGWKHEDLTGVNRKAFRMGKPLLLKGLKGVEIDRMLEKCQRFAKSVFGEKYTFFVNPGRDYFPVWPDEYYRRLVRHGFTTVGGDGSADPLLEPFERYKGLTAVHTTVYCDFYRRRGLPNNYTAEKFNQYLEAVKDQVRSRFKFGLYVCLTTHAIGFDMKPDPIFPFEGNNPGGRFLDELLEWVTTEYPKVEFAGVQDLVTK